MTTQKRAYLRPYTVTIPAGFQSTMLNVEGNFFFINESAVVLNVELKGAGEGGIMEFRKLQGFRSNVSSFRSLEIRRSNNDTSPDVAYTVNITAGTLPDGMSFFT
jgi:hypothetical protein